MTIHIDSSRNHLQLLATKSFGLCNEMQNGEYTNSMTMHRQNVATKSIDLRDDVQVDEYLYLMELLALQSRGMNRLFDDLEERNIKPERKNRKRISSAGSKIGCNIHRFNKVKSKSKREKLLIQNHESTRIRQMEKIHRILSDVEENPLKGISRLIADVNVMDESLKEAIEALTSAIADDDTLIFL